MMFRFKAWNFIMSFGPDNLAIMAFIFAVFFGGLVLLML